MPNYRNGKICYIEMPSRDVDESAAFYAAVFGWKHRRRGDGSLAFDDSVGEVSGTWVLGRTPGTGGIVIHVMIDDIDATTALVTSNGGEITVPVDRAASECFAHFRDPSGNVMSLYQEGGNKRT